MFNSNIKEIGRRKKGKKGGDNLKLIFRIYYERGKS